MKKLLFLLILIAIVLGAFYVEGFFTFAKPATSTPDAASVKEGTYRVESLDVTLVDGVSSQSAVPGSATTIETRYFGNEAIGDLNADGVPDTAFLLTQVSGGSGTFYYVVAALKTTRGYQGTNAILLGDRIAPQTTSISDGVIQVNYADRNPGEPFSTQPSRGVTKQLRVVEGVLAEIK